MSQSRSVSSGLRFNESVQYGVSPLYKEMAVKYCSKLQQFRKLHFTYCVKLINKTFKISNGKLVVSESAKSLFEKLTPHTESLFFILKVFFLVNISTLCGGRNMIDHVRYCSTYFYNQLLLDSLISEVIINASQGRGKLKEVFEDYCKRLYNTDGYEPYSGEFFQKVFNICHSLSSVKLSKED
ncbi:hypothetical protein K6025_00360 [Ehrlichia sp. JZT12]